MEQYSYGVLPAKGVDIYFLNAVVLLRLVFLPYA
jgi:hypothetical protein